LIGRNVSQLEGAHFFSLNATDMEPVPYLDLQAQYDTIRAEVLTALEEICESS